MRDLILLKNVQRIDDFRDELPKVLLTDRLVKIFRGVDLVKKRWWWQLAYQKQFSHWYFPKYIIEFLEGYNKLDPVGVDLVDLPDVFVPDAEELIQLLVGEAAL